ncbi:hypothetical protein [Planosporangium thailandense]|uniref:thiolase family protein n=1 Tax=Planosporangium thailandense TaxID=765197 RepID=UPI003B833D6D
MRTDDLAARVVRELTVRYGGVGSETTDAVDSAAPNQAGEDNRDVACMAAPLAGLPVGVSGTTVTRLCGSGLDAVADAARRHRRREADWR